MDDEQGREWDGWELSLAVTGVDVPIRSGDETSLARLSGLEGVLPDHCECCLLLVVLMA